MDLYITLLLTAILSLSIGYLFSITKNNKRRLDAYVNDVFRDFGKIRKDLEKIEVDMLRLDRKLRS
jgi:hypothetical protein